MKKIFLITTIFIFAYSTVFSFEKQDFESFRSQGLGGSNITFFDNQYTILNNPANLLYNSNKDLILPIFDVYFNNLFLSLAHKGRAISNGDTAGYSDVISSLKGALINVGMRQFPIIPFSYYTKHIGFAINTTTDMKFAAHKMYDVLNAYLAGTMKISSQITVGYARSIHIPLPLISDLKVGVSGGFSSVVSLKADRVDINGIVINGTNYLFDNSNYPDSPVIKNIVDSLPSIIKKEYSPLLNIGASVRILKFLGASLTVNDIANSLKPTTVNIGGILKPLYLVPSFLLKPINILFTVITPEDAKVILEMHDVFGTGFIRKLHFGMELSALHFFNEPFIYLDLGLNYGYPTFGIGIDAKFSRIYYSNITYEEGTYLGGKPNVVNRIGMELSF